MRQYKKYERYKDTGVEWIGKIPEEWDLSKIKYIPKYEYKSFVDGDWIESPYITDEGIRLIQTGNIGIGSYKEQGYRYISEDTFKDLNCTEVYPNDVLICRLAGPVGRACLAPSLTERMITSVDVCILKPKDNIDRRYLVYILSYDGYLQEADFLARGGTRQRISRTQLGNINILLPPTDQQKSIANFLDQKTAEIDGLIADKEKLIELLQEKRQAIITETVTKGLNPNVKMKDSGIEWIGEIPEHWRLSKIKYESLINNKTLSESTDDDYEIDYIDISSVTSIGEIDGVQSLNFKDAPSRARRILYKGDTIVSTVRTYLKAIAFIENAQSNLICSTGFAVLTPLSKVVPKYLFYLMRSEKYVNEIVRRSVGVSYPAVNASDIGALECALPDRDEQMYIVEYLDNCTTQINQLVNDIQAQIQKLKEYRQSLISEAVTGKIDVREFGSISEVI
ncbi:restriction endonuclease subunit S [Xylanivirga thermophila]|uniref:restriction endonuclease subunit S n=1 Tax=Xylanivirga thermophila TaxID=2496273 RepID=UPI00101E1823|nr:restriction endonuclease subunit S [Xylanivirga thermophila]